jgi:hypothetical protein
MELFDYDPMTGATEYYDFDPMSGQAKVTAVQELKPLLDHNLALRNEGIKNVKGSPIRHYATVPMTVILEMKSRGIDFYDKNDAPKVFREIESNYPHLKVDNMRHSIK